MKLFLSGLMLCAAISPVAAQAGTATPVNRPNHFNHSNGFNHINQRQHNEQARIQQGVHNRELTRRETGRLQAEQAKIRVDERFARKGKFTPAERFRIEREQQKASRDIYQQKHDGQDRNR